MKSKNLVILLVAASVAGISAVVMSNHSDVHPKPNSNPYIQEYSLPVGSGPNALLVDTTGKIWVSTSKPDLLLSFDPGSQEVSTHEIGDTSHVPVNNNTMVWTMVQDRDGIIWLSQLGTNSILSFAPENNESHRFSTSPPFQMKTGKQGEIWFSIINENKLGVIKKQNGYEISSFSIENKTGPAGIFIDGDFLWTAEVLAQKVAKYDIKRDRQGAESVSLDELYPRGNATFMSPTDVLVKGNVLWLTEHETSFLTSYNLSDNKITRYPTSQNPYHAVTLPFWIRSSNQGNILWFNEHQGSKIGYFDLDKKILTEYSILSLPPNGYVTYPLNLGINPNDDKIVWFSEWNADKIGMINSHTKIPFDVSVSNDSITLGPNETKSLSFFINGSNPISDNMLTLNASSSIVPDASLGNLTVKYSAEKINLTKTDAVQLYLHNNGVTPGNYTVGLSASDGFVTKIVYVGITIRK